MQPTNQDPNSSSLSDKGKNGPDEEAKHSSTEFAAKDEEETNHSSTEFSAKDEEETKHSSRKFAAKDEEETKQELEPNRSEKESVDHVRSEGDTGEKVLRIDGKDGEDCEKIELDFGTDDSGSHEDIIAKGQSEGEDVCEVLVVLADGTSLKEHEDNAQKREKPCSSENTNNQQEKMEGSPLVEHTHQIVPVVHDYGSPEAKGEKATAAAAVHCDPVASSDAAGFADGSQPRLSVSPERKDNTPAKSAAPVEVVVPTDDDEIVYGDTVRFGGNIQTYLGGRIVFGPKVILLGVSYILLVIPVLLFFIFLLDGVPPGLIAGDAILFVATCVLLFLTGATDPGIAPRRKPRRSTDDNVIGSLETIRLAQGETIKLNFCYTCCILKGPRTHHCAQCNCCIDNFDHHCIFTGLCVGAHNYKYFLWFLVVFSTLVLLGFFTLTWGPCAVALDEGRTVISAMKDGYYFTIVVIVWMWVLAAPSSGLMIFHFYLCGKGLTTFEHIRQKFAGVENPYDKGVCKNLAERCTGEVSERSYSMFYKPYLIEKLRRGKRPNKISL